MNRNWHIGLAILTTALWAIWTLAGCGSDDADPIAPHPDAYVHVSPDGWSAGDGSASQPLRSISQGMALAQSGGYRGLKLSIGLLRGDLVLVGGIDVIGGCDRDTWEPLAGGRTELRLQNKPVLAMDIGQPTRVRGLMVTMDPAHSNGPHSIALFLDGCTTDLRFDECHFVGGEGYSPPPGLPDGLLPPPTSSPLPGESRSCEDVVPGRGGYTDTFFPWNSGGDGGAPGQPGADGDDNCEFDDLCARGGDGGTPGGDGADGQDGTDGDNGDNGAVAPGPGFIVGYGIEVQDGGRGEQGHAGRGGGGGGGGGGSPTSAGAGGGGGGYGGPGGGRGEGGLAGGHSIGVISRHSTAVFRRCAISAGTAGSGSRGGNGTLGQPGVPGSVGGNACPGEAGAGGRGGQGGHGGAGGGGAGGNGGSSFALVRVGTGTPDLGPEVTLTAATAGSGGQGGLHGDGSSRAPDGLPGLSATYYLWPSTR